MAAEWTEHRIQYGGTTIRYALTYAPRKTLGISVHPDLSVTVKAPLDSDFVLIEQKVKKRAAWILRQQRTFERYLPGLPHRQYVSGETHRYLGRQYRLKVIQCDPGAEQVRMTRGRIFIHVRDPGDRKRVKRLLTQWYRRRAARVFRERLDACFDEVASLGIAYPELRIRIMKSRWGSCMPPGRIRLNLKLVQVSKRYIDYVIMHELCHLKEPNHSKAYYVLLDGVMPDWRERKRQLNEFQFG
jgi:predicted metal-dependent hydrolase